ncbi:MAG: ATP-binding cassette domain-containing protein [Proteobacteria bacterium]|nr:ATP-binding cassette domain-containing protein [Pseudomonadota bacterium]NIS72306.1 ATP-binding cassette domain-containing protein [Pseudomonadota bacterium]
MQITDLDVHYKDFQALWNVSLEVKEKKIVSIIGANGAGKSTLLNTISGLLTPSQGTIKFLGERIDGLPPHETVPRGITLVPEGRRIFPRLTVYENLVMGSYTPRTRPKRDEAMSKLYELFPVLKARHSQMGNTLSGGEQQMLALGRAMMSDPKLILCDEISLGLAPVVIKSIYRRLEQINRDGITIVLVEQDVKRSLRAAYWAYIMLEGKMVLEGEPSSLSEEEVKKAYFGI